MAPKMPMVRGAASFSTMTRGLNLGVISFRPAASPITDPRRSGCCALRSLPVGRYYCHRSAVVPCVSRASSPTSLNSIATLRCQYHADQRTGIFLTLRIPTRQLRHGLLQPFSSAVSAEAQAQAQARTRWWRRAARLAYFLRIPFVVLTVYTIGYRQGIMDYARDPSEMERQLLESVLLGVGCADPEEVLVAQEGEWRTLLSSFRAVDREEDERFRRMVMLRNVAVVGEKIVKVAQAHVRDTLKAAVKEATTRLPPEVLEDQKKLYRCLSEDEQVDIWTKATRHMEGKWSYVLIPSSMPNAFVTEILPHRIFITTALLQKFIESQDELALVLGHEISHLILGHSSSQNASETTLRTLEVLLLSLDPTPDGFLSFGFMTFLASLRHAIGAVYSRDNERCADELGIKLTAMACYDTHKASHVFYKMHLHNVESGMESSSSRAGWSGLTSFFDSHPPTEERFRTLLEESREENKGKYEDTSCATLKTIFWDAMKQDDVNKSF